mgnify:CR=1 FL=1
MVRRTDGYCTRVKVANRDPQPGCGAGHNSDHAASRAEEIGGVIHCYSYSKESARDFLNMGFYFGIGGVVTFKNAKKLKEAVAYIPLSNIVLETDAPYLTPEPFRGKRNDSSKLVYVAQAIADIKQIPVDEVYAETWENAHQMYKIQK